jgi:hypothetical protein
VRIFQDSPAFTFEINRVLGTKEHVISSFRPLPRDP